MKFHRLPLEGAFCIELDLIEDERGFFARSFCRKEFLSHGLDAHIEQSSLSYNKYKKTLRGMHFQLAPYAEVKIVTCLQGAIYDVLLDLRPESATFLQWHSVELKGEEEKALYIPKGFAHGFQTLEDDTKILYQISQSFEPTAYRGVRWNDPSFGIEWPYKSDLIISEKDQQHPDFIHEKSTSYRI